MLNHSRRRRTEKEQSWNPRKEERASKLKLSAHAWRRLAQRNLTVSDIVVALRYGRRIHRASADFFFLGAKDLPSGRENELSRLVGTTIVIEDNFIVTAYRNRRALAKVKRKAKRYGGGWRKAITNIQMGGNGSMAGARA
jgi:hypothetical protein